MSALSMPISAQFELSYTKTQFFMRYDANRALFRIIIKSDSR